MRDASRGCHTRGVQAGMTTLARTTASHSQHITLSAPAGVVLWEIITGERPQRGSLRMPRVPAECPQEVCDLCLQCLSEEPSERPTAHDLLNTLGAMLERKGARRSVDIGAALRYGGPAGTPHATSDAAGLSGGSAPRSDDAAFASSSAGAASAPPHASV